MEQGYKVTIIMKTAEKKQDMDINENEEEEEEERVEEGGEESIKSS